MKLQPDFQQELCLFCWLTALFEPLLSSSPNLKCRSQTGHSTSPCFTLLEHCLISSFIEI